MVGVHQRVVVAIDDALAAAIVQRVALAHRGEMFVLFGIALEVLWPVTAHLVEHQHGVLVQVVDEMLQALRSEEHTSELQSLMRISYAVFGLKKKKSKLN